MDLAIDPVDYLPTHDSAAELPALDIPSLLNLLVIQTKFIKQWPYNSEHWLARAHTLSQLRYPELAYGDAWKAEHCCTMLLEKRHSIPERRLGAHRGFWMYDPHHAGDEERQRSVEGLNISRDRAISLQKEVTKVLEDKAVVSFISRPYPWLEAHHRSRNDSLLQDVNHDLASGQPLDEDGQPYCQARRGAYSTPDTSNAVFDADEAWGIFARRPIPKGCTIIEDSSELWGCNCSRLNRQDASLYRYRNRLGRTHSCHDSDVMPLHQRWVQGIANDHSERTMLRVRCLLQCIEDGVSHPFDHPNLARLRPTYHRAELLHLDRSEDIVIPNLALLQFGIDILADQNFDTWVLLTIEARLDNNCWSQPNACCLNALFALFNHSCEPNIAWKCLDDHRTVHMSAVRQIEIGEQLFVQYNSYLDDRSVQERQRALRRWIDGDCGCTRCERETRTEMAARRDSPTEADAWNCGILSLPEDLLQSRSAPRQRRG